MGLTRPQAIIRRMDAAGHGLHGAIRSLARMLAIVDYEHEEDMRVFGYGRDPVPAYVNLREAARGAVEEAGGGGGAHRQRPAEGPGRAAPGREMANACGRNRHDHRVQELRRRTDGDLPEPGLRRPRPLLLDPGRTLRRPGATDIDRWPNAEPDPPAPDRAGRQLLARLRTPPAPEPLGAAAGFGTSFA